ncbi:annexin A10-like [Delphinus delphis]|uniref:annexin A10-like n=1 Tax=Delphinus delphis TaxID=9728 RepID=UPI0028C46402|nr:annexin A10-like [Delphinus delphis]
MEIPVAILGAHGSACPQRQGTCSHPPSSGSPRTPARGPQAEQPGWRPALRCHKMPADQVPEMRLSRHESLGNSREHEGCSGPPTAAQPLPAGQSGSAPVHSGPEPQLPAGNPSSPVPSRVTEGLRWQAQRYVVLSQTNPPTWAFSYPEYSRDLQEDIYSETSGHFRDTLVNLVQGTREEGYTDPATAAQDAMVLWESCQKRTGEHKTLLQMILCNKSYQQLWLVFQEFQTISGQDIVDAINECYHGSFQELLVAIVLCVRDKPGYFPYRLYSAIHDFGFHNKTVIRILIARSEIDLMTIRKRYKERYGKSLFHDIKHFASGHYEKALLAICAGDADDY